MGRALAGVAPFVHSAVERRSDRCEGSLLLLPALIVVAIGNVVWL